MSTKGSIAPAESGKIDIHAGGSSVSAQMPVANASDQPSTLTLQASSSLDKVALTFVSMLSGNLPVLTFNLRSNTTFVTQMELFESVKLESFDWDVVLMPGSSARLYWCFDTVARPANAHHYLAKPFGGVFVGSEGASTPCKASLPSNHPFGRELKALNLGNKPPVFHFRLVGAPANAEVGAVVRGVAVVSFYGRGVISANTIEPIALSSQE